MAMPLRASSSSRPSSRTECERMAAGVGIQLLRTVSRSLDAFLADHGACTTSPELPRLKSKTGLCTPRLRDAKPREPPSSGIHRPAHTRPIYPCRTFLVDAARKPALLLELLRAAFQGRSWEVSATPPDGCRRTRPEAPEDLHWVTLLPVRQRGLGFNKCPLLMAARAIGGWRSVQ